jgi:DNA-binding NarL/FixJ family response regulator
MSSTSQTTSDHRAYKCMKGQQQGKMTCPEVTARAEWVEKAVVEEIGRIATEPTMRQLLEEEVKQFAGRQDEGLKKERVQLQRKLNTLNERFQRWADEFGDGAMSKKQFLAYSQKLEAEQSAAEECLEQIDCELENRQGRQQWGELLRDKLMDFPSIWQNLGNDERRLLLSLLIENNTLTVDRVGRDIKLRLKVHLLPPVERVILYQSLRGKNRSNATGLQLLTKRQMVLLYHAAEGRSFNECAELMGCRVQSIHSTKTIICRNLGGVTWPEAVEMAREQVHSYGSQLPFGSRGRAARLEEEASSEEVSSGAGDTGNERFLSPVLMQVFELFAQGAQVPQVAKALHPPISTVQGRRQRILKIFGVSTIFEAVQEAKRLGIL